MQSNGRDCDNRKDHKTRYQRMLSENRNDLHSGRQWQGMVGVKAQSCFNLKWVVITLIQFLPLGTLELNWN